MNTTITSNAHYEKYEAIYQAKLADGHDVSRLIPATKKEVLEAIAAGDEHLNSIPLIKWDRAANYVGWTSKDANGKPFKSLAEQVCLLKHAAKYHYSK